MGDASILSSLQNGSWSWQEFFLMEAQKLKPSIIEE